MEGLHMNLDSNIVLYLPSMVFHLNSTKLLFAEWVLSGTEGSGWDKKLKSKLVTCYPLWHCRMCEHIWQLLLLIYKSNRHKGTLVFIWCVCFWPYGECLSTTFHPFISSKLLREMCNSLAAKRCTIFNSRVPGRCIEFFQKESMKDAERLSFRAHRRTLCTVCMFIWSTVKNCVQYVQLGPVLSIGCWTGVDHKSSFS